MDSDGLPLVGPGIDYTKVGAINQKRTLAFLNHFITHTVRFMNRFSCVCEEKLEALSIRLQRLETSMNIVEAKLSSIPGLENVTVSNSQTVGSSSINDSSQQQSSNASQVSQQTTETVQADTGDTVENTKEDVVDETPKMTVAQDPRYAKYFKMVQVGVPAAALKPKMIAEGLDASLLDTPDAPAPGGGTSAQPKQESDSESDFSDDNDDDDDEKEQESDSSSGFSD